MVDMDLYVARVLDVTRDTISSTISCCAVSSVRGFWRHANRKDFATLELEKGRTGLHQCHGQEGDALHGTLRTQTHLHSPMYKRAASPQVLQPSPPKLARQQSMRTSAVESTSSP